MENKDKSYEGVIMAVGATIFVILVYFYFNDRDRFYIYLGLVLFAGGVIAIAVYKISKGRFERIYDKKNSEEILDNMRAMNPAEFEDNIEDIYNRLGYATEVVGASEKGWVDVIATKNGVRHYIQGKKFINSEVTLEDVRAFYEAIARDLIGNKGIIITTRKFLREAKEFAKDKPIDLIYSAALISLVRQAGKSKGRAVIEKPKRPSCSCGR